MENRKQCDYCGEEIAPDVRRCPYCGSLLNADENTIPEASSGPGGDTQGMQEDDILSQFMIPENGPGTEKPGKEKGTESPGAPGIKNAYAPKVPGPVQQSLSNGMKVFLTALCVAVPGLGQLAGIIIAIVFMNTEDNEDKKSFGLALLIASLIFFLLSCLSCFIIAGVVSMTSGMRTR